MGDNDLNEIDTTNRTYYDSDDLNHINDIDISEINFDEKSFENLYIESYLVQNICILFFLK